MPYYSGKPISDGQVTLGAPDMNALHAISLAPDVAWEVRHWIEAAESSETVVCFAIFWQNQWVGEITLHDIDWEGGESLIAYHLFDPRQRGRGIGTRALGLLVGYVRRATTLRRLVIITS